MSHELDSTNGVTSFVTARKPAWHRLGTVFPTVLTAEEALREAHLADWNVRKLPVTATEVTEDGVEILDVPGFQAVARTNPITGKTQILGAVGDGYVHVQNESQVEFLQTLLDESGAFIETAGALRGGRQVFFTCKLPTTMLIGGVDEMSLYMAALNGHDGSMAFKSICTPVRIVCANTQHAALSQARQSWSRRHTTNAMAAIAEARKTLQLSWKFGETFRAEAERMIQTTLNDGEFDAIVKRLYGDVTDDDSPLQERRKIERLDVMHGLFSDAETQKNIRGTRWAAYQAISEYEDWMTPVRAGDDGMDMRRALRAVDGKGVQLKEKAFSLLSVPDTSSVLMLG